MGRLLTLMTLMILGALAVRTQRAPSPYMTGGSPNGVGWREASDLEKLYFVRGVNDGMNRGIFGMVGACRPAPSWFYHKTTVGDVTKEMDSFYEDGVHISLPLIDGYVYSAMKLAGATKEELDSYLKAAR